MFAPLSTQMQAVLGICRSSVLRVQPYKNAPRLQIAVRGGMHDQCGNDIQLDEIRVGADPISDFVLLDPEVAADHLRIVVSNSLMGPLATVFACGGAVRANGQTIEVGEVSGHLKLPIEIAICDDISLRLGKRSAPQKKASRSDRLLRRLMTTAAVLGLASACLFAFEASNGQLFVLKSGNRAANTMIPPPRDEMTLERFREKLAQAGIGNALRVSMTADGLFEVRGRLTPAQARTWRSIAIWYDSVAIAKPMVTFFESAEQLPRIPPVSLVRLSEPKEILLVSGKSMSVDTSFSGDWTIAAIERDHIVIARGGDQEILRFAGPKR